MSHQDPTASNSDASRRSFLKNTSAVATAGVLASNLSRSVHAGEDNKIRVALAARHAGKTLEGDQGKSANNPLQRSGEASVLEVENLSSPPAER